MRHRHLSPLLLPGMLCAAALLVSSCERPLGEAPVGAPIVDDEMVIIDPDTGLPPDSVSQNMSIGIEPNPVAASNLSAQASVTVHLYDSRRNPIAGQEVRFRADAGLVYARDTTNALGVARVPYFSAPFNGDVRIYAQATVDNRVITVSRAVVQTGISIEIEPQKSVTVLSDTVLTSIRILDGTGRGVDNAVITLSGAAHSEGRSSSDGLFWTRVFTRRTRDDTVTVTATAAGASASRTVTFRRQLDETTVPDTDRSSFMRIYSGSTQLKADNSDRTTITVLLLNSPDLRNPAVGRTIRFQTTLGSITEEAKVDSTGHARAMLRSEPTNGTAVITATNTETSESVSTSVVFGGVRVELASSVPAQEVNNEIILEALVRDGSDNLIGNQSITFFINENGVGRFANGQRTFTTQLSPAGLATAVLTSPTAGTSTINAMALNTSATLAVQFTTNRLTLTTSRLQLPVGGADEARITATYVDGSRNPVPDATIQFATNAGTLNSVSATTNSQGQASTTLRSADFSGTATVEARAGGGSARVNVEFTAGSPASIEFSVSPDNIPIVTGKATLRAVVRDSGGNLVNRADVNFRILSGPGDREHIESPLVTATGGVATTTLHAGRIPSRYRSVEVLAKVGGIEARSKLTISGEPYIITVSVPEYDTVAVPRGGVLDETTMDLNVGAVVQDINGNPVADGTEVHFSAVVSGMSVAVRRFVRWEVTATDINPIIEYRFIDVPFEDINNNFRADPNVDLDLDGNPDVSRRGDDVNGDGIMDYDISRHDFFWFFEGPEPYWPPSVQYFVEKDPSKPNYRPPDTTITSTVVTTVAPTIREDGSGVDYDTTYSLRSDTSITWPAYDSTYTIYADLNRNGRWDPHPREIDHNNNGVYDGPESGDFEWWRWEMRPYWEGQRFDFSHNEFAVTIPSSAQTVGGVAYAKLTYPRQLARRLYVTINAEANGKRDRDGERVLLPLIR